MPVDILIGLQWGDEGKGKIVDYLAPNYEMIARFQGGPNAGHTLVIGDKKMVLHTVPSGIFRDGLINLIGGGVVINPMTLKKEIEELEALGVSVKDRLFIAKKAHLILPTHLLLDSASEKAKGKEKIGSTLRGIGPTYMDKTGRNGLRVGDTLERSFKDSYDRLKAKHIDLLKKYYGEEPDLAAIEKEWMEAIEFLKGFNIVNGEYFINEFLEKGKNILAEGAQGTMLDIDFGTYPYVTSSSTTSAGACIGLGIAPKHIRDVIGITKAYCTRVGEGPFPTELLDATGEQLRSEGHEFGATTGRPRRCGWIDIPQVRYAAMINGVTKLAVTKMDVLNVFPILKACTKYRVNGKETMELPFELAGNLDPMYEEFAGWNQPITAKHFRELPQNAKDYITTLERLIGAPVAMLSTGPEREQLLVKE